VRNVSAIGRTAAIAAVVIAGVAVAVIVLRGGSSYTVKAEFQNASQLVKGNLVQVSGRPVGKVTAITLTDNGQAEVTMNVDDAYAPLREGTQATVRASSLSGIANRYVDLNLAPASARGIPKGGVIDASHTTTAVDLDEIFNVFDPKTRQSLRNVFRGSANQYTGKGAPANAGLAYLNPSIASSAALFSELNHDTDSFKRFISANAHLVTDVSQRANDLAGLVDNLATTTGAIGRQRGALQDAIQQLPDFMRRANTTFVNLRATLDDLTPLVDESKPVAKKLRPFLRELRPLAQDAQPTVRDLVTLIKKSGANNDLIDLTASNVPVRDVAVGPVQANGASREGAFPASTRALKASTPELASARPYAPDLMGWFDDFSHSGVYDALGGVSRAALYVNLFTLAGNGTPNIGPACNLVQGLTGSGLQNPLCSSSSGFVNPTDRATNFAANAKLHQNNRCPGSMERDTGDGSIDLKAFSAQTNCDPTQTPIGP
jgi:phospholipid/cholesterol/gamma-HCH transport system substrate-binding protein